MATCPTLISSGVLVAIAGQRSAAFFVVAFRGSRSADTTAEMPAILDDLRLLRPREAADLLGVSVRQIDRIVDAGTLRPVRLLPGGNRRFRLADLAALVNDETNEED